MLGGKGFNKMTQQRWLGLQTARDPTREGEGEGE